MTSVCQECLRRTCRAAGKPTDQVAPVSAATLLRFPPAQLRDVEIGKRQVAHFPPPTAVALSSRATNTAR